MRFFKNKQRKLSILIVLFAMVWQLFSPLFSRDVLAITNDNVTNNDQSLSEIKHITQDYLDTGYGYSKKALVAILMQEDISEKTALATIDTMAINFNEQSLMAASQIVGQTPGFTRERVLNSLLDEGFSQTEADYAFQNIDFHNLAVKEARKNMQYGGQPIKKELIINLQNFGYSIDIAKKATNTAYIEYEREQEKVLEIVSNYLKNNYYSQDKLVNEISVNYDLNYYVTLDLAFESLAIDWKQQGLGQANNLLKNKPDITGKELSIKLQDAWFRTDEIDYALRNIERNISLDEVKQAVSDLEEEEGIENLATAEYLLSKLAESTEKDKLLTRVEKVKDKRKQLASELAIKLIEAMPQSRAYLIETLEHYAFTRTEAVYAVDNSQTDWYQQAYLQAKIHLDETPDSKKGSLSHLTDDWNFTAAEALYGVNQTQTNWEKQALILAQELLSYDNHSEQELFDHLKDREFTDREAVYASRSALGLDPNNKETDEKKIMVTVRDLNLRSRANNTASPTVYLPEGSQLEFLEITENDWFKLSYQGKTGYTHRGNVTSLDNYNTKENPKTHDAELVEPANYEEFIVVIDANLRTKDANPYRSIALMPEGSQVTHLGTTRNGWFKVLYGNQEGYIHRGDVTSFKNYYSKVTEIHQIELAKKANQKEFVSIIEQNLRTGNTNQHRSVTLINRGESVTHLGTTSNGWFKVRYQEQIGYVYRGDLTSRKNYRKLHE